MLEGVLQRVLRAVLGSGADISALNPLPVDASPGNKVVDAIVNDAVLAAAGITTLADCLLTGAHTAAAHAIVMTDANAHFRDSSLIGLTINNDTDGSTGVITANTKTTVTAVLVGGVANQWALADAYTIVGAGLDMVEGSSTLALTVDARYNAAAVAGMTVHVITSPTGSATGIHTAANNAVVMTDANAHFIANALIGLRINNVADGSSGVVTANTETTVTVAALVGGVLNQWTTLDTYAIPGADYDTEDWDSWNPAFAANAVLQQTEHYDTAPAYIKVLIENLDLAQTITDITVRATRGG